MSRVYTKCKQAKCFCHCFTQKPHILRLKRHMEKYSDESTEALTG